MSHVLCGYGSQLKRLAVGFLHGLMIVLVIADFPAPVLVSFPRIGYLLLSVSCQ